VHAIRPLATLVISVFVCSPAVAQVQFELVARQGMTTPSGGTLDLNATGRTGRIDPQGNVAFLGVDLFGDSSSVERLYHYDGLGLEALISVGDEATPAGPTITDLIRVRRCTDSGEVIFEALLSNGKTGHYRVDPVTRLVEEYIQVSTSNPASPSFSRSGDMAITTSERLITIIEGVTRESFEVGSIAPGIAGDPVITGVSQYGLVETEAGTKAVVSASFQLP